MRTTSISRGLGRSPRELTPTSTDGKPVTRLARSLVILLLANAALAYRPIECAAGSITYDIVNYPSLQNGHTVSGTITTNGTTGSDLSYQNITSWNITIQSVYTFTPSDSFVFGTFNATDQTLTTGGTLELSQSAFRPTEINWSSALNFYNALNPYPQSLWSSSWTTSDVIATVPEPSTAILAGIGLAAL